MVGVGGWPPLRKVNMDDLCRRVRVGSEDGIRDSAGLLGGKGVTLPGEGDFAPDAPLILRAILRNGDMDREIVLVLGERPFFSPLGGVAR